MMDEIRVATMNSAAMDEGFNSTVEKLKTFFENLSNREKNVFHEMLCAARDHTDEVQASNEGDPTKTIYDKPVQVHKTSSMKAIMKRLPSLFPVK